MSVLAVAGVGSVISAIGLLTADADGSVAALYAAGLGAGLVSLLCLGIAAGARSQVATVADVEDRLTQQVEIHANRIEGVARSLGDGHHWRPDALREEIERAECGYESALQLGATEHARRLTDALAYVRAATGVTTEPRTPNRGRTWEL